MAECRAVDSSAICLDWICGRLEIADWRKSGKAISTEYSGKPRCKPSWVQNNADLDDAETRFVHCKHCKHARVQHRIIVPYHDICLLMLLFPILILLCSLGLPEYSPELWMPLLLLLPLFSLPRRVIFTSVASD